MARQTSRSCAATRCGIRRSSRATTWRRSTASSPIRRSRWKSGVTRSGPAIPTDATSPACRRTRAATTPGSSTWFSPWPRRLAAWPSCCRMVPCSAWVRKARFARSSWAWTCSKPSSAWSESVLRHRPCRVHPGLPSAEGEGPARRRCSSSTPRTSSRPAGRRTNCCPSTSSASTAGTATTRTWKASPAW